MQPGQAAIHRGMHLCNGSEKWKGLKGHGAGQGLSEAYMCAKVRGVEGDGRGRWVSRAGSGSLRLA